ncbi:MAG TPA: hypothetical protein DEP35_05295 [Deltaproteobacteria bacterium]|nr:hypothetical protein [Deltaproteobacteria bacterium]
MPARAQTNHRKTLPGRVRNWTSRRLCGSGSQSIKGELRIRRTSGAPALNRAAVPGLPAIGALRQKLEPVAFDRLSYGDYRDEALGNRVSFESNPF